MSFATKKSLFASILASVLVAGYAGAASSMQAIAPDGAPASAPVPVPPPSSAPADGSSYFSKHFSTDALAAEVKNTVIQANLAPVPFNKIVAQTRDQVTTSGGQPGQTGQANPTTYTVTVVLENAGHGLIRRMQAVQSQDANLVTRFDLTYRGYFPFLTQTIPANANALPPIVEARKVLRFDTNTDGHLVFAYQYGANGQATFADPGQVICNVGKDYSASELNAAIQGQARELNCQTVDTNGIVTDKMKLAYLEKYGVALVLHTQNPESSLDSTVTDFTVE
ncbi:hypothetical protein [Dyella caseinilytica]|uniref:Uncharacterized protein n=1 Tax=Dyella caseinilytica TaxID=1849581 RepID=A0ABX7GRA6_9GAMM|nr:hypothetical protein [Dyella caseinilytica]QRN52785.1 hypothetical protein ISN74_15200 [Dyella caseinilytica]GGA08697.1 hypothetical protein GCM10011408_32630 [Dyella caseinilytica]